MWLLSVIMVRKANTITGLKSLFSLFKIIGNINLAYGRNWFFLCVQMEATIPKQSEMKEKKHYYLFCFMCHMSRDMCPVSSVNCHESHSTCLRHLSLMPIATATNPPPDKCPTINSRLSHKDQNSWKEKNEAQKIIEMARKQKPLEVCQY